MPLSVDFPFAGEPVAMEQAALAYLDLGWSVIPVQPLDKRPLMRWREFQQRRPDRDEILRWFRRSPAANLAVVTGRVSGLVVVDLDPRHGGIESLARLERERGSLPRTVESVTGGGGCHLFFAHPGVRLANRAGLLPGIDLRGDGGYAVLPPSMHASGRRYRWRTPPGALPLAPSPGWLVPQPQGSEPVPWGHPVAHWRRLAREGVGEGCRNDSLASLAGHLLQRGVDAGVTRELLLAWNASRCHPPLGEEEVVRTLASILRLHQRDQR